MLLQQILYHQLSHLPRSNKSFQKYTGSSPILKRNIFVYDIRRRKKKIKTSSRMQASITTKSSPACSTASHLSRFSAQGWSAFRDIFQCVWKETGECIPHLIYDQTHPVLFVLGPNVS